MRSGGGEVGDDSDMFFHSLSHLITCDNFMFLNHFFYENKLGSTDKQLVNVIGCRMVKKIN